MIFHNTQAAIKVQSLRALNSAVPMVPAISFFFGVDGNIYDGDGYLIADNANTPGCEECVEPGVTEIMVLPVPGSCNLFYLISGVHLNNSDALAVYILDMDADNPRYSNPSRKGKVLHWQTDLTNQTGPYFQFDVWALQNRRTDYSGSLGNAGNIKADRIKLDAMDPQWSSGELILHVTTDDQVIHFRVKSNGIEQEWSILHSALSSSFDHWAHDTEFGIDQSNGDILFALTNCRLSGNPDYKPFSNSTNFGYYPLQVLRMSALTGDLQLDGHEGYNPFGALNCQNPITSGTLYGCAFAEGGSKIILTRAGGNAPHVVAYDLSNNSVTDLSTLTTPNIPSPMDKVEGRLEQNIAPNGTEDAIFFPHANGVSVLVGLDDLSTSTWIEQIPTSAALNSVPQSNVSYVGAPFILSGQVFQGQNILSIQGGSAPCCEFQSTNLSEPGFQSSASAQFTPSANPWGLSPEVYFKEDVRISAGHSISVNNMTWRFAPGKKLIIEAGATLIFNNGALTSWQCDELMWEGVRIGGDALNTSQSANAQGRFLLLNTEVSNAMIGARTIGVNANGSLIPNSTGGRIHATNSKFKNNLIGVQIDRYHRRFGNNEYPNLSHFSNCQFVTDNDWKNPALTPNIHAWLLDVNGVNFSNCSFRNDDIASFGVDQRGYGIYSFDATFKCKGNMQYADFHFEGLTAGIIALSPDPAFNYEVDGMGFENNAYYGILDLHGKNMYITNNQFKTNSTDVLPGMQSSVGAYLWESNGYVFERNTFEKDAAALSPGVGVWFRGPAFQDNQIYDNTFDGLNAGCVVDGDHIGQNPAGGNTVPGLQLLCGDYGSTQANIYDCALVPVNNTSANYRHDQGLPLKPANNRFFTPRPGPGPDWDIVAWPTLDKGLVDIHYFYSSWTPNPEPELRPEWIHDLSIPPVSLSYVDDYYDLVRVPSPSQFDKHSGCEDGILDGAGSGQINQMTQEYETRIQELNSAILNYQGEVDGGESVDLMELIEFPDPWYPSHTLRDEMLNQAPLSNEVMLAAIWREQPMDSWHLTQVLINNSELSNEIWAALEESQVLSAFYINYLEQYDQEQSMRSLFEQEITLRQQQVSTAQRRIIHHFANDTIVPSPQDSIDHYLAMDPSPSSLRMRYWLAVENGNEELASTLGEQLNSLKGNQDLLTLGNLYTTEGNDLLALSSENFSDLQRIADTPDSYGAALAFGLLHANKQRSDQPYAVLPPEMRAPVIRNESSTFKEIDLLAAYPNPASDRIMITYSKEVQSGYVELFDAQGKLLKRVSLSDQIGFVEFDLSDQEAGLYLAQLIFEGVNMAQTKFTIVK